MSKSDFSDVFLVVRKTQQVAPWSRDGVSRGAFASLVVTRSTRDHPKSESRLRFSEYRF